MSVPRGYTGHARDLLRGQVVHDPNIEITDDVRILQRVDGAFVIFDRRLPLGRDGGVFPTLKQAIVAALTAEGKVA